MIVNVSRLFAALGRLETEVIPHSIEERVSDLTESFYAAVSRRTPVDTGQLRAGWKKAILGRGIARVGIVSNGVPYVRFVEEGTPTQAPRGFIALTLRDLRAGRL